MVQKLISCEYWLISHYDVARKKSVLSWAGGGVEASILKKLERKPKKQTMLEKAYSSERVDRLSNWILEAPWTHSLALFCLRELSHEMGIITIHNSQSCCKD